jgi:aryl carrier-like protein
LLPAPAVPSAIRLVDGFVLGPNQKLLPGTPVVHLTPSASPGPADGPTIDWLRRRLGDLVDHPMGDDENFFEAGLNSLLLLLLHADLARELDRPFPVTALFAHPNLRALADFLEGGRPERGAVAWSAQTADPSMLRHEGQVRRNLRRRLRDQH